MELNKNKVWLWLAGAILIVFTFVLSDSVKNTIRRQRLIKKAEAELTQLSKDTEEMRKKIDRLESHPKSYERLVRKELGYLKPGETEVRFLGD